MGSGKKRKKLDLWKSSIDEGASESCVDFFFLDDARRHSPLCSFFFFLRFRVFPLFLPYPNRFKMAPAGIAVGLNKGHVVTKVEKTARPAARKGVSVTCWKNRRGAASTSDGG